jgi:hypothetical protein
MKKGDFDIEKTFGQVVPLHSVRAREDWPLPIQQSGQDQQTQHHNKQEEPDAMIQIPAPARLIAYQSGMERPSRLASGLATRTCTSSETE